MCQVNTVIMISITKRLGENAINIYVQEGKYPEMNFIQ